MPMKSHKTISCRSLYWDMNLLSYRCPGVKSAWSHSQYQWRSIPGIQCVKSTISGDINVKQRIGWCFHIKSVLPVYVFLHWKYQTAWRRLATPGFIYITLEVVTSCTPVLSSALPLITSLIASFMGPTWDPPGADRTQVGPMKMAIWDNIVTITPSPLRSLFVVLGVCWALSRHNDTS